MAAIIAYAGGMLSIPGVDYSTSRPDPTQLHEAGYRFVFRYLTQQPEGLRKALTRGEVDELHAAGLAIVFGHEAYERRTLEGAAAGRRDIDECLMALHAVGAPMNSVIYFATDFNIAPGEYHKVADYCIGAANGGGNELLGMYGHADLLSYLFAQGVIAYGFQAGAATAWRGNASRYFRAQLYQYRNGTNIAGGTVDLITANTTDYGQWEAPMSLDSNDFNTIWHGDIDSGDRTITAGSALLGVYDTVAKIRADIADLKQAIDGLPGVAGVPADQVRQIFHDELAKVVLRVDQA